MPGSTNIISAQKRVHDFSISAIDSRRTASSGIVYYCIIGFVYYILFVSVIPLYHLSQLFRGGPLILSKLFIALSTCT